MKKVIIILLIAVLAYFLSPRGNRLRVMEKRGTSVINTYLYELPADWMSLLQNLSGSLYSNTDENFLTGYIDSLKNSRTLAIETYDFTNNTMRSLLKDLAKTGADIRILTENDKSFQLTNSYKNLLSYYGEVSNNVQVRSDNHLSTQYLHSNFIVTSSGVWIQTADLTDDGFNKYREYFFWSDDSSLHNGLRSLFEMDWNGDEINREKLYSNLVVCNVNCRDVITDLITKAEKSIIIQGEELSDPSIFALLSQKSDEVVWKDNGYGRMITGAFEMKAIFPNTKNGKLLSETIGTGHIRLMRRPYNHAKVMLIDHKWLLIGSIDLTHESLDTNRDVGVLINDKTVIERFLSGFNEERDSLDRYYCLYGECEEKKNK